MSATDNDVDNEVQNHNYRYNLLENYSYESHLMCTNLMQNAVLKAANQEISKRAKFYVSEKCGSVTLVNAEQLFKTYDTVSGTFTSAAGDVPFTFTPGKTVVCMADAQNYTITEVTAAGTGNADNNNAERNEQYKGFSTALAVQQVEIDALTLSTKSHLVKAGDPVTLNAAFDKMISSNTAVLTYSFDGSLFEYVGFDAAEGVTVINEESGEGFAKITVMRPGYDLEAFGNIELLAKADADLADGRQQVGLDLEYVVKDENGEKEIKTIGAHVFFVTANKDRVPGDTNDDGKVDLIDLSNMVDWFGTRSTNPDWDAKYIFFDFNSNNQIDVYDISYVARLIA